MYPTESPGGRTLLVVTVVVWAIFEVRQSQRQRPEAKPADRGSQYPVRVSALVGFIGAFILRRSVPSAAISPAKVALWVGLALMWCGIGLRVWSFQTLGRYFTFTVQTSEDQPVISNGPYRVIRHPSYAAILVILIGLGLVLGNWVSLAVLSAAALCGIVYRIKVEEGALMHELGGRYQSYAEHRKRLVPFVW